MSAADGGSRDVPCDRALRRGIALAKRPPIVPLAAVAAGGETRVQTSHTSIASEPAWARMHWAARGLLIVALAVSASIVALHVGLLPRGGWGADEYQTFGMFREYGWSYLWFRFWSWSPRPFSEALVALYALLVRATDRPHLVPVLSVFWTAALVALLPALSGTRGLARIYRLLGALSLLCAVILGRDVGSVFYWPFGAVAYAPVVVVGMALLFRSAAAPAPTRGERLVIGGSLIAVAWASEVGAMLVTVYACMTVLWQVWRRQRIGLDTWLPLLAATALVAGLVLGTRGAMPMLPEGNAARYHHPIASILAAAQQLLPEALSLDGRRFDGASLLGGTAVKLAFFLGIQGCWMAVNPAYRDARGRLPVLALSFPLTCFAILAASYYQFGTDCCDRHAFVRQAFWFMTVAALAIWTAPAAEPGRGWRGVATPVALLFAVGLMSVPRVPDLWRDYAAYQEPMVARALTWQSGRSPGSTMTLFQPRSDNLYANQIPNHPDGCAAGWWVDSIRHYFPGKTCIRVVSGADLPKR